MHHCERCGSGYDSARALWVVNCPRCLLRSDVASPLVPGPPPKSKARRLAQKEARERDLKLEPDT